MNRRLAAVGCPDPARPSAIRAEVRSLSGWPPRPRFSPGCRASYGSACQPPRAVTATGGLVESGDASGCSSVKRRFVRVQRLEPLNRGQIRLTCDDRIVEARFVVIAAGAWSRPLARQVGDNILSIRNAATMSNLPWTLFRSGGPSARLILAFISRRWKVVCGSRDRSSLAGSPRR